MGIEDKMNAAIAHDLRVYARRRWPSENDKYRKDRLRDLLKVSVRRMRSLWEGEETAVPRTHETDRIEALIGKKIGAPDLTEEEANAVVRSQEEYRALEARIAALEAFFRAGDEEHGGPHLDALRELAAGSGRVPQTGRR